MTWDWHDLTKDHRFSFLMVSPWNLGETYGELDGVDLSGSSISEAYYSDTRASGKIRYHGDGWRRGSLIRVVDHIGGEDRVIGTYVVTRDDGGYENGRWYTDLTLNGMLYMLSTDKLGNPMVVAKGASLSEAARKVITDGMRSADPFSVPDRSASDDTVFEGSKSRLEVLFKLCEMLGARIDVSPLGHIVVGPYTLPQSRAQTLTLDLNDPMGVAHDDLTRSSDWLSLPSMAVVSYKFSRDEPTGEKYQDGRDKTKSVEHELVGIAYLEHDQWHSAVGPRGYRVTDYYTLSEMSPETQERANQVALERLRAGGHENLDWSLTTQMLPLHEGDALRLVLPGDDTALGYARQRSVFVKSLTVDLGSASMRLVLKEVTGRDER